MSRIDFRKSQTVLVNNDLYAFEEANPMTAYKISFSTRTGDLVKTDLKSTLLD